MVPSIVYPVAWTFLLGSLVSYWNSSTAISCLHGAGMKLYQSAMSDELTMTTLIGFHGCDAASVGGIRTQNFRCSTGEHHWLGEGVYFFGHGISDPVEDAKRWAIAQSWDNGRKCRLYQTIAVIKAMIVAKKPFDMTKDEGKTAVNRARKELAKRMNPIGGYEDNQIIGWLAQKLHFDVLIQDFFIQMTSERRLKIRSRYPNVRVICVREPNSAIDKEAIHVTYEGQIPFNPQ